MKEGFHMIAVHAGHRRRREHRPMTARALETLYGSA